MHFAIKIFLQFRHGTFLLWCSTEQKESFPFSIRIFFCTITVYETILFCRQQQNLSEDLLPFFIFKSLGFLNEKKRLQQILFNLNFLCAKQFLMNHVMHSRDQLVWILINCIRRGCLIIYLKPFSLEQICKQTLSV